MGRKNMPDPLADAILRRASGFGVEDQKTRSIVWRTHSPM